MSFLVTVVVPTYEREQLLERCLHALLSQAFDRTRYAIIVVDDGRSRKTQALVEALASREGPALRYLRPLAEKRGPAAARNRGWREASSELIAFTDDDTIPHPDWLAEGLNAMQGDAAAAWGQVIVPISTAPSDYELNVKRLENAGFVTANCFVRRAVLEDIGGFDERFTRAWREDSDLYFSLLERGARVVHAPCAIVQHPARAARWAVAVKEQKNMLFDALLFKKHPRLYREKIGRAPVAYLAIVATLLLALIGFAAGAEALLFPALIAWFALTAALAWKRVRGTKQTAKHVFEVVVTSIAIPVLAVGWRLAGAIRFRVLFA